MCWTRFTQSSFYLDIVVYFKTDTTHKAWHLHSWLFLVWNLVDKTPEKSRAIQETKPTYLSAPKQQGNRSTSIVNTAAIHPRTFARFEGVHQSHNVTTSPLGVPGASGGTRGAVGRAEMKVNCAQRPITYTWVGRWVTLGRGPTSGRGCVNGAGEYPIWSKVTLCGFLFGFRGSKASIVRMFVVLHCQVFVLHCWLFCIV